MEYEAGLDLAGMRKKQAMKFSMDDSEYTTSPSSRRGRVTSNGTDMRAKYPNTNASDVYFSDEVFSGGARAAGSSRSPRCHHPPHNWGSTSHGSSANHYSNDSTVVNDVSDSSSHPLLSVLHRHVKDSASKREAVLREVDEMLMEEEEDASSGFCSSNEDTERAGSRNKKSSRRLKKKLHPAEVRDTASPVLFQMSNLLREQKRASEVLTVQIPPLDHRGESGGSTPASGELSRAGVGETEEMSSSGKVKETMRDGTSDGASKKRAESMKLLVDAMSQSLGLSDAQVATILSTLQDAEKETKGRSKEEERGGKSSTTRTPRSPSVSRSPRRSGSPSPLDKRNKHRTSTSPPPPRSPTRSSRSRSPGKGAEQTRLLNRVFSVHKFTDLTPALTTTTSTTDSNNETADVMTTSEMISTASHPTNV